MRLARSEQAPVLRLFDEAESELVARALIALSQIEPTSTRSSPRRRRCARAIPWAGSNATHSRWWRT
jgi:hypothetical protein